MNDLFPTFLLTDDLVLNSVRKNDSTELAFSFSFDCINCFNCNSAFGTNPDTGQFFCFRTFANFWSIWTG